MSHRSQFYLIYSSYARDIHNLETLLHFMLTVKDSVFIFIYLKPISNISNYNFIYLLLLKIYLC